MTMARRKVPAGPPNSLLLLRRECHWAASTLASEFDRVGANFSFICLFVRCAVAPRSCQNEGNIVAVDLSFFDITIPSGCRNLARQCAAGCLQSDRNWLVSVTARGFALPGARGVGRERGQGKRKYGQQGQECSLHGRRMLSTLRVLLKTDLKPACFTLFYRCDRKQRTPSIPYKRANALRRRVRDRLAAHPGAPPRPQTSSRTDPREPCSPPDRQKDSDLPDRVSGASRISRPG